MLQYKNNKNKIFFFNIFKNKIISYEFADTILKYFYSNEETLLIDRFTYFVQNIEERYINVKILEQIDFSKDINILNSVQMIDLFTNIKTFDWIYDNIFENILWGLFINTSEFYQKRVTIVYLISYILSQYINSDMKSNPKFLNLLSWVVSIFDPQHEVDKITVYDKIVALPGFIDCCKIPNNPLITSTQRVLKDIISKYGDEMLPYDMMDYIKKLNLL
jgi:hypothetical protein